ncbi:MAG TPA: protein phosphatase 2C domain-containing protein [Acidobacteriota bacterium]|nr:protein phosphatase 2C domain-containing protein [Acidobacteriota bacterium]
MPNFLSGVASDPGHVRENNEDRVYADDRRGIYLVIDGVGGAAGGERAAAIAEGEILARLERAAGSIEDRIREGIALADRRIFEQAQRNPALSGMACVLTVAMLSDGEAIVGHVGDTRLYKIRHGVIEKITSDHSPVGAREDAGEISEIEAMNHPRRNEIFRDVGSGERRPDDSDFVEMHRISLEGDCALLLCSDGLTDQVSSSEILRIVASNAGNPGSAAKELIRHANDAGGKDNVSVVYIEGPSFAAALEQKTGSRFPGRIAAGVLAGMALGVLVTTGYLRYYHSSESLPPRQIMTVAQDAGGTFATLEEALAVARPGDTIEVLPGVYREHVVMKEGVHLVSRPPGQAVIQPKPDASQSGAAVVIENTHSGLITGFRIAGAERNGLSIGVLVADSQVDLEDLDIEGATSAGILIRGSSRPSIRASRVHNNYGAGILIQDDAMPRLISNLITGNGNDPEAPRSGVEVVARARPVLLDNVFANNFRNLSWETTPGVEAEVRKQNVFVEQGQPGRARPKSGERKK